MTVCWVLFLFPREAAIIGMLSKRTPFASQKDYICLLKGLLLECKRTTFGMQKDYIFRMNQKKCPAKAKA